MSHVDLDGIASWVTLHRQLTEQINDLDEKRKAVGERIKTALGDAEEGHIDDVPVVRWSHVTSRRLDQKLLKSKVATEVLAGCYLEHTFRRFTILGSKDST
ncbi:MAG: hypothetical protein ACRDQA_20115 [Nocardioidaceae bacterium]